MALALPNVVVSPSDYGLLPGHALIPGTIDADAPYPCTESALMLRSTGASDDDASTCTSVGTIAAPDVPRNRGITPSEHGSVCACTDTCSMCARRVCLRVFGIRGVGVIVWGVW